VNRRAFLSSIAAIAAGATLDPERLLWRPRAKLISIPAAIQPPIELYQPLVDFSERWQQDQERRWMRLLFVRGTLVRIDSWPGRMPPFVPVVLLAK
jgi:hypothetical protein